MKRFTLVSILFILCTLIGSIAQNNRHTTYTARLDEALRLYNLDEPTPQSDSTALDLFLQVAGLAMQQNDYATATSAYINAGNIHQGYQRFAEAHVNYHSSLRINRQYLRDPALYYEAWLYMGSSFYFSNIIDSARYYFEQASAVASTDKSGKLPEQERLYNSLGAIYFESANYLQAKNYFEKALQLTPAATKDDTETIIGVTNNIANCLLRLNRFDTVLQIYKSLQQYEMEPETRHIINQNTAHIYYEMKQYDSALSLYKKIPVTDGLNRVKALNDIGRIYMNLEQWQQSEAVFDSAIAVNKRISSRIRNKEEALAYLYRGQLAARQGLTDEAITWCNEALEEVHLSFIWKPAEDVPGDVSQTVSPLTLFEILRTKARLLQEKFRRRNQPQFLQASLNCYRKAIETANYIKLNFDNDEAKLFFNQNYQLFYNEAIHAAHTRQLVSGDGTDEYIFILENYKGSILHQNLQNVLLKSAAEVPDSIRNKEKELKQLLAFYTSRINNSAAEADAGFIQKRLTGLQVELSRLQKQYEKDESYQLFRYRAAGEEINLKNLQEKLDGETALINYYQADSLIYLLALNNQKALLTTIKKDSFLQQTLQSFLHEIYRYTEGNRFEGDEASARLYESLLQPAGAVTANRKKWIIVPDGELYYVPFETLTPVAGSRTYVVEDHTISYHYSFSLLFQHNTHHYNDNTIRETVAFAPYAGNNRAVVQTAGLPLLPHSKEEIRSFISSSYVGEKATKQKFLEVASRFPRIHLATHASAGNDSSGSWIQFYPGDSNRLNDKLFLNEIYNLDLHRAELVILSACETGSGRLISGEGLLSLSRAFVYAGSDGIIATLWKTEDQVTAYLMQRLHHHLATDASPEKALQLAKIDLLHEKNISAKYKTPNYWGNFIYVGKVSMMKSGPTGFRWVLLACLSVILLLVVVKQKRSRHTPEPR